MKELTSESVCLALGYFDSVHLGHRALISVAREYATAHGLDCAAATFSNNAYKLFNADGKQVYTYAERCVLMDGLCDSILPMRFDSRLKNSSGEAFLDWLTAHYSIKAFVCGYDYSFGAGAECDAEYLEDYCARKGLDCIIVPKFTTDDGERVSTTAVKELLSAGDIERANALLGEPFFITGKVVRGRGAGRMFDIPTANVKLPASKLLPADGTYGTACTVDGKLYYGATNVGPRPTFGLTKTVVETMLDGFNDNIYGKDVTVHFYKYLRPIVKFQTPDLLSKQVHNDIAWRRK